MHSEGFETTADLAARVNALVDRWCERRALNALRQILAGWPSPLRLTDDWMELRDSLRNVVALARHELTTDEVDSIADLMAAIDVATRRPDRGQPGDIAAR